VTETPDPARSAAHTERQELLEQIRDLLDRPMIVLSLVWLVLVVLDLAGYGSRFLEILSYVLWAVFVLHFLLEFVIAPDKTEYLKDNWLTALALLAPALRLLRIARLVRALRAARAVRGLRLLRVVSTANRGLRTARRTLARRGIGYVLAINVVVLLVGAAGMYAFERPPDGGLRSYGESLYWTAMLLTTLGSEYWPRTVEGRVLAWLLALFAFSVFGYVTATLASLFVQQDARAGDSETPSAADLAALTEEVRALRAALRGTAPGSAEGVGHAGPPPHAPQP
jgi:voltage-gated potassium channel